MLSPENHSQMETWTRAIGHSNHQSNNGLYTIKAKQLFAVAMAAKLS